MERLKKTVGLILLVSFSLCVISVPAYADNPWNDEDRPTKGPQDPPQDKIFVPSSKGSGASQVYLDGGGTYLSTGFLVEISYQLAILMGHEGVGVKASAGSSAMCTR